MPPRRTGMHNETAGACLQETSSAWIFSSKSLRIMPASGMTTRTEVGVACHPRPPLPPLQGAWWWHLTEWRYYEVMAVEADLGGATRTFVNAYDPRVTDFEALLEDRGDQMMLGDFNTYRLSCFYRQEMTRATAREEALDGAINSWHPGNLKGITYCLLRSYKKISGFFNWCIFRCRIRIWNPFLSLDLIFGVIGKNPKNMEKSLFFKVI